MDTWTQIQHMDTDTWTIHRSGRANQTMDHIFILTFIQYRYIKGCQGMHTVWLYGPSQRSGLRIFCVTNPQPMNLGFQPILLVPCMMDDLRYPPPTETFSLPFLPARLDYSRECYAVLFPKSEIIRLCCATIDRLATTHLFLPVGGNWDFGATTT